MAKRVVIARFSREAWGDFTALRCKPSVMADADCRLSLPYSGMCLAKQPYTAVGSRR